MPAMQPYSRMAKDSSGVGRRDSNRRTGMPLAAMTQAAAWANSSEWWRQSKQIATPWAAALGPSAKMTWAKASVAWRTTYRFMRLMPMPMTPRSPAVPNSRGPKKRDSISFSSPAMASSSARSASVKTGLVRQA
jgi:hypothetical protein